MTKTDSKTARGLACMAWLALTAAACDDKGSLGDYPETEGGSGSADDGDDGGATTTGANTTASASETSATATDTATAGSDDGSGTLCAGSDDDCHVFPVECDAGPNGCGSLNSPFDEEGCLRQACGDDDGCAADERCYRAIDFGGCASSGTFCMDDFETSTCQCSADPDCGGGYCVPAGLYPEIDPLPGDGIESNDCGPGDGPARRLRFGLPSSACDAAEPPPGTLLVDIRIDLDMLTPGTYSVGPAFGGGGDATSFSVGSDELVGGSAVVTITAADASGLDGSWMAFFDDGKVTLDGEFEDLPYCPVPVPCG